MDIYDMYMIRMCKNMSKGEVVIFVVMLGAHMRVLTPINNSISMQTLHER